MCGVAIFISHPSSLVNRYLVEVESPKFKGMSVIAQHRLVSGILKDDIANMHAVRIFTKASSSGDPK